MRLGQCLVSIFLLIALSCSAAIIPADRRITWIPGIPGGVPNRPVIFTVLPAGSSAATIQAALNACPTNLVVKLDPGNYSLSTALIVPSDVTLRGDGSTNTILTLNTPGNPQPLIRFDGGAPNGRCSPTGDISVNEADITLDPGCAPVDKNQFTIGTLVILSDVPGETVDIGQNDGCPWCGVATGQGRWLSQIFTITNRAGDKIYFDRGTYKGWSLSLSAVADAVLNQVNYAGVEDMKLVTAHTDSISGGAIEMQGGYRCWVRNVTVTGATKSSIWLRFCKECEVRDSFVDTPQFTSSGAGYGIHLYGPNSDCLVENNIIYNARHSLVHEGGGSGNVFGYNFSVACHSTDSVGWVYQDMITHGAHPFFCLYEGNVIHKWSEDYVHGSAGLNTAFRNWITAGTEVQTNYTYTTAHWAVEDEPTNNFMNVVGNILGAPAITNLTGHAYEWTAGSTDGFIYTLGYMVPGSLPRSDTRPGESIYLTGNFDYITGTTIWASTNADHVLPNSLYLNSKPSWYGTNRWPTIGSDLSPLVSYIPAQTRWYGGSAPTPPVHGRASLVINGRAVIQNGTVQ